MKKNLLASIVVAATASVAAPAADACTSLIASPGATADGSTIITYAADSHVLYGELYSRPAADHKPGEMRKIIEWDTKKYLGEIPEVAHTYGRIGNMNEHGLVISESTWGGREELMDTTGIIDYGSLIYIALERCKTAREAITCMTNLVKEYGYYSEGESFSIGDNKEAWIMEMIGKGGKSRGAVWVARRIPDGYISGHANHSRIHKFPLKDKTKETLYSPDVISFARSQGYFSGKDEDFDFSRAYAVYDMMALRGCDARVWSYYNRFTEGGVDEYLPWVMKGEGDPMPLWIKPTKKVTVNEMKWMMRDHFEGTPMDMTKDVGAGPYLVPYRWRPLSYVVDGVEYTHERAIATQQTGFSFVAQLRADRPESMKGILWFGCDDANTCVYVPMFNCLTEAPAEFAEGNGDMYTISWTSNFWVNNYVANQAYNRYSQMIPDIRRVQSSLEDSITSTLATLEAQVKTMSDDQARFALQDFSRQWSTTVTTRYKQLGDYLLVKFLDGNIKKEKDGQFARTPEGMPVSPVFGGYDDRYFRNIVKENGDRLKVIEVKQQ
jgi:dipeptidase